MYAIRSYYAQSRNSFLVLPPFSCPPLLIGFPKVQVKLLVETKESSKDIKSPPSLSFTSTLVKVVDEVVITIENRITSYNVCYTKLLRYDSNPSFPLVCF